jgi:hypothetical protein
MSADEVAHAPRHLTPEEQRQWHSSVLFAGTWMPERGPFLARLVQLGVPLSIFGDRWHKAREWEQLHHYWRGPGIYNEEDYARAVQCADVCLGLLSKGNRDLSTTRSFEIPHLGGVLCAERCDSAIANAYNACFVKNHEPFLSKFAITGYRSTPYEPAVVESQDACLSGTGGPVFVRVSHQ